MLDRVKRRELKNLKYDFAAVDALLKIGDRFGKSRPTSGMVEMQKGLKELAEWRGFLPAIVREESESYPGKKKNL